MVLYTSKAITPVCVLIVLFPVFLITAKNVYGAALNTAAALLRMHPSVPDHAESEKKTDMFVPLGLAKTLVGHLLAVPTLVRSK